MTGAGFILREFQGIPYYGCLAFESLPYLRHGFSSRRGGAPDSGESSLNLGETPWDSPARVQENRTRFLSALKLSGAPLVTIRQVHSSRVHIIEDISAQWNQTEGDAMITRVENITLGVKTADCLPVLLADPVGRAVAAVHSGWRGTLAGILPRTILEMQRVFGSDPSQLLAAVGPGIRACCYDVGSDVAGLFGEAYPGCCVKSPANTLQAKYFLDLPKILDEQMRIAGIRPENRHDLGACTRCNMREFFSYRAEGPAAGRLMSVIGIASP